VFSILLHVVVVARPVFQEVFVKQVHPVHRSHARIVAHLIQLHADVIASHHILEQLVKI